MSGRATKKSLRGRRKKVPEDGVKELIEIDEADKEINSSSDTKAKEDVSDVKADDRAEDEHADHNNANAEGQKGQRQRITFEDSPPKESAGTSSSPNKLLERAKRFANSPKEVCVKKKIVFDPTTLGDMEDRKRRRLIRFS
uniref:Uncharacterized protein n=1 Tax=Trichuris muris TaxID=70415 RepID=A0A5S6QRJ5_TRIMR